MKMITNLQAATGDLNLVYADNNEGKVTNTVASYASVMEPRSRWHQRQSEYYRCGFQAGRPLRAHRS